MEHFKLLIFTLLLAVLAVCIDVGLGYTADDTSEGDSAYLAGDGLDLDDLAALHQMFATPIKRGFCRNGFSYSAVLRRCIPSLAFLKGRGRRY
ncbi:hypothetical protein ScPMuIL_016121 [Solemya velum]